MKQNANGQKGFTAALMVISMLMGAGLGTYVLYQVAHNKAGIITKYINHEKYSRTNLAALHTDTPAKFKAVMARCQTPAGIKNMGRAACTNARWVNTQLLGNYS
jgi:hypothetical protein